MTCFGHLFGHFQAILDDLYFLYYIITHILHLYLYNGRSSYSIGVSVIGV
jgi:hypothetical protein